MDSLEICMGLSVSYVHWDAMNISCHIRFLKFINFIYPFWYAEGRRCDASMLVDSNLLQELERNAFSPTGQPMSVYGDPAYPLWIHLQAPFRHGVLTPMIEQYNFDMSSVRVTVEWLFGDIINDFKFLDFKKNLKMGMSWVGKMYLACALLNNAVTCLYGNKASEFFGLDPLSLQYYFR